MSTPITTTYDTKPVLRCTTAYPTDNRQYAALKAINGAPKVAFEGFTPGILIPPCAERRSKFHVAAMRVLPQRRLRIRKLRTGRLRKLRR